MHLKQIKNNQNRFNGNKTAMLAKLQQKNDEFETLVQYKVDSPYCISLENTTIISLELSIIYENNNIIYFHVCVCVCSRTYLLYIRIIKKNNL